MVRLKEESELCVRYRQRVRQYFCMSDYESSFTYTGATCSENYRRITPAYSFDYWYACFRYTPPPPPPPPQWPLTAL